MSKKLGRPDFAAVLDIDLGRDDNQHYGHACIDQVTLQGHERHGVDHCIGYEFELVDVHRAESLRRERSQAKQTNTRTVSSGRSRRLVISTVLPVAVVSLHSAVAENSPGDRSIAKRFYVGGSLGMSRVNPDAFCPCLTVGNENDLAVKLLAGIDISKRFSVEAYYSDLGAASVDFLGDNVGEIDYSVAGLHGVFYFLNLDSSGSFYDDEGYYRREGLSLYAKLGAGIMRNDSSLDYTRNNDVHLSAALGAEYGFQNGLAVRAEINSYDTDAQQINASIVKRFGEPADYKQPAIVRQVIPQPTPPKPQAVPQPAPEPQAVPVEFPTVYFDFARSNLTATARSSLDDLASVLDMQKDLNLVVEGHTDWVGSDNYNLLLSTDRAASVKRYLIDSGIEASRIKLSGMGESAPAADNASPDGRAANRRVEFSLGQ